MAARAPATGRPAARLVVIAWTFWRLWRGYRQYRAGRRADAPEAFVASLIRLGPAFVKLGQILSTRPDVMPPAYVAALAQLQAAQPPVAFAQVERVLVDALGADWRQRFRRFDQQPAAAASLAQVHRAELADSGEAVAVKVRRPDIRRLVLRDLEALALGMRWLGRLRPGAMRRSNLPAFLAEFRRYTLQELDFQNEARTVDRFRANLRDRPYARLPAVHWAHTRAAVLTMDWVDGVSLAEAVERLDDAARRRLVERLVDTLLAMFIGDGLFHADLHPGNIRFHTDGSFTLLDFGMYGELSPRQRDRFVLYWLAVVQRQPRRAFHHFTAQTRRLAGADEAAFYQCFEALSERWYAARLSELSFTQVYLEMMRAGYRFGFVFPPELMLHAKALSTAEALIFTLDPEARFEALSRPAIARQLSTRLADPVSLRNRLSQLLPELLLLGELPPPEAVDDRWDQQATEEVVGEAVSAMVEQARGFLDQAGAWRAVLERHVRAGLAASSLELDADRVLERTWREYYALEATVPVAPTLGALFTTHLAAATLALHRGLVGEGLAPAQATRLVYDIGWRLYRRMGEPPLLVAGAFSRDPAKRLKIATELFRRFPFGEPGYRWRDVPAEPDVVAFDCLECPVARFFAAHYAAELCVNTWCELDFPLARQWGGRLERTGTLASGAEHCDFRWHAATVGEGGGT